MPDKTSCDKIILLVQDRAGWHRSKKVEFREGIIEEFLPPFSPEAQPANQLWLLVDEPLVNEHFETIEQMEEALAIRCVTLQNMREEIKNLTNYYWLKYS